MAWTAPMTFVDGTALTATQLNTYLRDNFMETEVAKATSAEGMFIATGLNSIIQRVGGSAFIDEAETTGSLTYTDLATVGPEISCNTGTRAFFFMTSFMSISSTSAASFMALEVSGQTTKPAADLGAAQVDGLGNDTGMRMGIAGFFEDLVPGDNFFTCKYKVDQGTGTFSDRALTVIPF